jgi:hypothetical protein
VAIALGGYNGTGAGVMLIVVALEVMLVLVQERVQVEEGKLREKSGGMKFKYCYVLIRRC